MARQGSTVPVLASREERRRARDRSILRDGLVALVLVTSLWGAWLVREQADPTHPPAVALTQQLDALYRDVRAGVLDLDTQPRTVAPGVVGARFPRVTADDRWVLTGSSGGACYVLWWDEAGARRTRTLPSGYACEPTTEAMSPRPGSYARIGLEVVSDPAAPSAWTGVVPDPVRLRWWYLPWMIVGGGLLLSALVRVSIALLTGAPPSATRR